MNLGSVSMHCPWFERLNIIFMVVRDFKILVHPFEG